MKYFDTFTGIGGFTKAIEQAYEKLSNKKINGTIELCNANTVKQEQNSIRTTNQDVKIVLENSSLNGEKTILNKVEKQEENTQQSEDKKSSICTEESADVVESQKKSSSHLNTSDKTDTKIEKSMGQDTCINLPLKNKTLINTKYSATTATTQEGDMENVPICVGYSEIDKYASSIYAKHYPKHRNFGDITTINEKTLPDFDLLVGGFPCQSFSIAGKRGGFGDTRGTLFFDIARIIKQKQPRLLLLENVKGLLSHDKGQTFTTIISTLDELGYDCQWQVLNSKNFGVPQNRERVFIVGHLRGTSRPEVFPFTGATEHDSGKIKVVGNLDSPTWQKRNESIRRVHDISGLSPTIPTGTGGGVMAKIQIPEATKKGYAEAVEGDSINLSVPNSKTRRGRVGHGVAQTIDTGMQQHTLQDSRIRRLTPVECERLQGFPDGWTEGVSDTQRYKCCGNAVTVNVVQAIIERLIK